MGVVDDFLSKTDLVVDCRSGFTYAERPTAFRWKNHQHAIEAVNTEWHSPIGKHFQVTTENGHIFELIYNHAKDTWQILKT